MKRVVFAVILGFVFPVVCLMILGIIGDYLPESLMLAKMLGEPAPGLLVAPFTISVYLDILLKQKHIAPIIFDNFLFRFSSFVFFNWVLYGIISYLILGKLKRFKRAKIEFSETPPPPNFEEIK
jgi:hypothetical protein